MREAICRDLDWFGIRLDGLKNDGAKGEAARCSRCGEPFASRMHIDDLKHIERELGIRYEPVRVKATAATAGSSLS